MTARPIRLTATEQAIGRRWLPVARAALAACHRDPYPEITERQRVDQALAATKAVR